MSLLENIRTRVRRRQKPENIPICSIVVVIFNMEREARRTLYSLTRKYQEGVQEHDYEVIVVDNGSKSPLSTEFIRGLGSNFKYFYVENASPSPAPAINIGARLSRGRFLGIMVDGARILTPGVVRYALLALQAFPNPLVSTLGWHLGHDIQNRSIFNGYTKEVEDQLLESISWSKQGYRLFEISTLAWSCASGWFMPINESNCIFMAKATYVRLGGCDERFDSPGGGLVNLDLYERACSLSETELVILLGEGTFHQVHGGVATNVSEERNKMLWKGWEDQYIRIRNKRFAPSLKKAQYVGHVPASALKSILYSTEIALKNCGNTYD